MDPLEFILWLVGIAVIGVPAVFFGIPCILAGIAIWRGFK